MSPTRSIDGFRVSGARAEHGFTLVELLVTMAMSAIVFGATLTVFEVFQKDSHTDQVRNETQDLARSAIDRLARDLRNVAAPNSGTSGALEVAEPYAVTFDTVDSTKVTAGNPNNDMRVRYCLNDAEPDNEELWLQVKRWGETEAALPTATACPDTNAGDWETSTRLVTHLTNRLSSHHFGGEGERPLFVYGPSGASTTAQINSVESTLYVDVNPGGRPGETQLTTAIALRNANRPPKASFTAVQLGSSRLVLLDASESVDPDGQALTYKWWDGSTELPTTAQQYETGSLTLGSKHTYKLTVTDPGGLSASAEETVTIK
jgi:prepilin-type N-terminal cleavage/methylation domain-containing protein